jgi:hypothetical protein|tara:strand:+ start:321 stop:1028 length:708 start_codon:yes stop_codon:yes gene_type:complete
MFEDVLGDWPKHDRFILVSCDEKYLNKYFPRFYKTFTQHWQLPVHVHLIDPSQNSLGRLNDLGISHTYCNTNAEYLKWAYSFATYCQAQRFIVLGHKASDTQSVIVADVDAYALRSPSTAQKDILFGDMAFTTFNTRLMATFCHFHPSRRQEYMQSAKMMKDMILNVDTIGVDQQVLKKVFSQLPYNELNHGEWIRHLDVKTPTQKLLHETCLIYHEKGTRGKNKSVGTTWTDIE